MRRGRFCLLWQEAGPAPSFAPRHGGALFFGLDVRAYSACCSIRALTSAGIPSGYRWRSGPGRVATGGRAFSNGNAGTEALRARLRRWKVPSHSHPVVRRLQIGPARPQPGGAIFIHVGAAVARAREFHIRQPRLDRSLRRPVSAARRCMPPGSRRPRLRLAPSRHARTEAPRSSSTGRAAGREIAGGKAQSAPPGVPGSQTMADRPPSRPCPEAAPAPIRTNGAGLSP